MNQSGRDIYAALCGFADQLAAACVREATVTLPALAFVSLDQMLIQEFGGVPSAKISIRTQGCKITVWGDHD